MGYFRQPFMAQREQEPRLPPRILKLSKHNHTLPLPLCAYHSEPRECLLFALSPPS